MRKILLFSIIALFCLPGFAQISTRENQEPSVFKTGTRPQKGNFGIWIGPSITEFIQMADDNINWRGMPLINFKYYTSDRFVFRVGLQIYNKSHGLTAKQRLTDSVDLKHSKSNTYFMITPGVEYHFTPKNVVDVYVGGSLPLGCNSIINKTSYSLGKDKIKYNQIQNQFLFGFGTFVGLQCFVADLPLAIGLEFGLSGFGKFGGAVKNVVSEMNEKGKYEEKVYYTHYDAEFDEGMMQAKKISTSKFELGYDLRITLSYYFGK